MATAVRLDDRQWKLFFKRTAKRIRNPQPFLRAAFSTIGFRDIIKHFQNERGPRRVWKKSERAKNEGGRTLQDTGNLRGNFLPGNIENQGRDAIIFFNPTPYANVHDQGSKRRNIPQREFMYLTDRAQEKMLVAIMDRILK